MINQQEILGIGIQRKVSFHNLEKVQKLGQGGCGVVSLYRSKKDGKEYVVKESKDTSNELIQKQYQNLKRLQEKNICNSFLCPVQLEKKGDKNILIMEYLKDYKSLYFIKSLGNDLTIKLCKKLLEKVNLLHRNGFCHNDIKPLNIMIKLNGREQVRLIDFGSMTFGNSNLYKVPMTQPYISPYVKKKRQLQYVFSFQTLLKNDLWATGITILQIISGKFHGIPRITEHNIAQRNLQLKTILGISFDLFSSKLVK